MSDRYVVAGLARARTPWYDRVGRWATEAAIPVEFVRCVSASELRSRLDGGRAWSAVLLAADASGVDRDLLAAARDAGAVPLVVVDDASRDWVAVGAAGVLPIGFDRDQLLEALASTSLPVPDVPAAALPVPDDADRRAAGRLIAVTGSGGTGTSTVAIALAQGLAAAGDRSVALADLRRVAEQAMLHDARRVVPGLQELVEAHRTGAPDLEAVRTAMLPVEARGYDLLLGLRRPRQWPVLRPVALGASLAGLRQAYDAVVCDVDPQVEGEQETGSVDVEERHLVSRLVLGRADVVVVVGAPGMKGLYALTRLLGELLAFGVPGDRVLTVVNRAPRRRAARAAVASGVAELLDGQLAGAALASPVFVPERRVEDALRDGVPLPAGVVDVVTAAALGLLGHAQPLAPPTRFPVPVRVVPGELGLGGEVSA